MIAPPSIRVSHGAHFDPHSPTLFGPMRSVGFCLARDDARFDAFVWCDFAAPIVSGSIATLFVQTRHGLEIAGKLMQRTHDGRWWALSWASRDEDSLNAMPLDHPRAGIIAIAAEVARVEIPRARPAEAYVSTLPPELMGALRRVSAPALDEWRRYGFPPHAELPVRCAGIPESLRGLRC